MPTPITLTDINIINQALTGRLSELEVTDLAVETNKRARIMRHNYEPVSEAAQVKTNWRFNTTKVALVKLLAVPINKWSAQWQLPADNLKVITTWPPSRYEILGDKLHTNNTDQVHIDYQRKLSEGLWPPWFVQFVIAELVIATARGITGKDPTPAMKDALVTARSDAFFADAQQQPNETDMPNEFVDCRA